jgi:hypothetical protein
LPAEPLLRLIGSLGGPAVLGLGQKSAEMKAYERALKSGRLTLSAADKLAVFLGLHPVEVWGDTFYAV